VGHDLPPAWHHREWYRRIQEALAPGAPPARRRLLLVAPPGASKSTAVSHLAVAWYLGRWPSRSVLAVTSSDSMARQFSLVVGQTLAESEAHRRVFPEAEARPDPEKGWSSDGFYLQGVPAGVKDPSYRCAGFGASVIGSRCHLLLLDDALTQEAAQSAVAMDAARRYIDQSLLTRLHPDGVALAIGTRFAEGDLVAHLEAAGFEAVVYPQLATEYHRDASGAPLPDVDRDAEGRAPLWPERFPLEWVQAEQQRLGSSQFELIHMANPLLMGGAVWRSAQWFRDLPPVYHQLTAAGRSFTDGLVRCTYLDLAWSSKQTADWTAAVTVAYHPADPARALYVVGIWRRRIDQDGLAEALMEHLTAVQPQLVGVEQGAYQQAATAALIQRMVYLSNNRLATYIRAIPSVQDKVTRARPAAAKGEAGLLYCDKTLEAYPILERECLSLPAGAHDDLADALSGAAAMAIYGVEQLTGGQVTPGGPVRATFGASRSSPTLRAVLR